MNNIYWKKFSLFLYALTGITTLWLFNDLLLTKIPSSLSFAIFILSYVVLRFFEWFILTAHRLRDEHENWKRFFGHSVLMILGFCGFFLGLYIDAWIDVYRFGDKGDILGHFLGLIYIPAGSVYIFDINFNQVRTLFRNMGRQ